MHGSSQADPPGVAKTAELLYVSRVNLTSIRAVALALVLGACASGATTPAGPVGSATDVRADLKPEVAKKAPKDEDATKQSFAVDVQGVKAKLVWRTFEDGAGKYILSYQWEVEQPGAGYTLEPLGDLEPVNVGTEAAPVESQTVRLRWHDNTSGCRTHFGELSVRIDAAGKGQVL